MNWWFVGLSASIILATQAHAFEKAPVCQELLRSFVFPSNFQSSEGIKRNSHTYTQDRLFYMKPGVQSYQETLGARFVSFVESLPAEAVRIESGPGNMCAARDYALNTPNGPKLIVIAPELSRDLSNFEALKLILGPQRFYPILGKGTQDVDEIPASSADVFDDCMAAGSYHSPDVIVRKALHWLKVGGKAFFALSTRNYLVEQRTVTRRRFLGLGPTKTETVWRDRSIKEFFESISGVEIAIREYEIKPNDWIFQIEITKLTEATFVPELELVSSIDDYPPERRFLMK